MWLDPRDNTEGGNGEVDDMHHHIKEYSKFAYLEGTVYFNLFITRFVIIRLWI